ncbi:unnamed protein product [Mytilus coruscus]|uniref:Ig-like domain-containing protein n=1 Tax=Mytilus coruscus TaxID=42192 RepID=A0A6J8CC18_MYTCO|nr:unnamed protein product [Mytilus coruscus]
MEHYTFSIGHLGNLTDIDLQSKPTECYVYKGMDVTMEQCYDDQRKPIAVKWYKEGDKRTELDVSNEQYSGGVPDNPSLTVRNSKIEDAGIYVCFMIYDNEKTKTSPFKLKIIPQVKIYKAILKHRADKTFIRPAICDTIDTQLQENNIVVISGREGTGKSRICLELASCYEKHDYMIMKVDLSENYTIYTDIADALLIIDDEKYSQDYINDFMKHHSQVLLKRNIKVILTCGNLNSDIVRSLPEINKLKKEAFIDINSCLTAEEKEKMLNQYMKVNNIAKSASNESNFKNPIILTDLSVQVTLDEDAIKAIKNEEPWKGFPMCASLFCSERKFLHLGEKYFTNPPRYLFEELKELYKTAKKNSNSIDTVNEYCILVYIMDNSYHQLDLNDPNLCRKLVELYQTFQFKCIPEKPCSNEDQKIAIEKAAHRMNNKYLKLHEGIYKFIHPCMSKAMFLSSDSMVLYLLRNGSLHDITEFVRSIDYTALESELVIKVDENYHHILCESLFRVPTGNMQPLDNDSFSAKNIKEVSVTFCKIVMLVVELTIKGRDPWIYRADTADVFILCGLVSAAMGRYATIRKILLSEFQNRIHTKTFEKLCSKPLDMYENTFFHYLMLFKQMEESDILYVNEYVFDTENVKEYTPLDIAAYLGKVNVLEDLNLKTNCTKKIRDRLKRLAKSGHVKFYNENLESKAIDRIMVNKNNDDGASSEKLQSEDADDEKKEVKDESTKKKILFKRTFSHSKNKRNKTEKHGTNNSELEFIGVLCFDDDMIKVVDFGEKMDYHAIIKLLSK